MKEVTDALTFRDLCDCFHETMESYSSLNEAVTRTDKLFAVAMVHPAKDRLCNPYVDLCITFKLNTTKFLINMWLIFENLFYEKFT